LETRFLAGVSVFSSAQEISQEITNGRRPDREKALDSLCGARWYSDPVARFWEAIEQAIPVRSPGAKICTFIEGGKS
jgi:hypothetical protein